MEELDLVTIKTNITIHGKEYCWYDLLQGHSWCPKNVVFEGSLCKYIIEYYGITVRSNQQVIIPNESAKEFLRPRLASSRVGYFFAYTFIV